MPEPEGSTAPVIIIKKKSGHAGHHGGAWKVAYADFVTAMMALFIVLWLLNTNTKIQKAIAAYFTNGSGAGKQLGSGVGGSGESLTVGQGDMGKLKEKLEQAMKQMPKFEQMKDHVALSVTGEGLRVELLESAKGMFFEIGNAHPTQNGEELLVRLAQELGSIPNQILIEGHTDAAPYSGVREYGNWELSADRANSARRIMEENGLREGQVRQVRGFADRQLRMPADPTNPANRRVSLIVQYLNPATATEHVKSSSPATKPDSTVPPVKLAPSAPVQANSKQPAIQPSAKPTPMPVPQPPGAKPSATPVKPAASPSKASR